MSRRNAHLQQDPVSPRGDPGFTIDCTRHSQEQRRAPRFAILQFIPLGIPERQRSGTAFAINCTREPPGIGMSVWPQETPTGHPFFAINCTRYRNRRKKPPLASIRSMDRTIACHSVAGP